MINRHWKRILALALALLLSGCSLSTQPEPLPVLPESTATPPPLQYEGETTFMARLYFMRASNRLELEERELTLPESGSRAEAVVLALMDGPTNSELQSVFVTRTQLTFLGAQVSGDTCLIYFSGGSGGAENDLLIIRAALAQSLYETIGTQYTDIYVDNAPPGYEGRPIGALQPPGTGIDVISQQAPPSYGDAEGEEVLESRNAIFYFTDDAAELFFTEVHPLQYGVNATIDEILAQLISTLAEGPSSSGARRSVPQNLAFMGSSFHELVQGEGALQIADEQQLTSFVPAWGYLVVRLETADTLFDPAITYGAIVNSITSFLPRLLGVSLVINGAVIGPGGMEELPVQPSSGIGYSRADFSAMLGNTVSLCYPERSGLGLHTVSRLLTQEAAYDPLRYLQALFSGGADASTVWEESLMPADVLSVSIQGAQAVINFRSGFFEKLDAAARAGALPLDPTQNAQLLVYSIVNTMCIWPGVDSVYLLEDGARVMRAMGQQGNTSPGIYIGNALYYNPGIMLS